MIESSDLISGVAKNASSDAVVAIDEARKLSAAINHQMVGEADGSPYLIDYVIECMINILEDPDLMEFLELEDKIAFDIADLEKVTEVIDLL